MHTTPNLEPGKLPWQITLANYPGTNYPGKRFALVKETNQGKSKLNPLKSALIQGSGRSHPFNTNVFDG
jgi:hypothetical protein